MNKTKPTVDIKVYSTDSRRVKLWKEYCYRGIRENEPGRISASTLVNEFEELGLEALQDPSSADFKVFTAMMDQIATAANVNLYVVVGHSNLCVSYLRDLQARIQSGKTKYNVNSELPNVLLVVACYGTEQLPVLSGLAESMNLFVFGFQDLVHVVNGEIYNCIESHTKVPILSCKFPGAQENLNSLNENESFNTNINSHPVKQCCKAKFGAFTKLFIEQLNHRDCTKISPKKIIERFQQLHSMKNKKTNTPHFFTFGPEDGTLCVPEDPCVVPSEQMIKNNSLSKNFNLKQGPLEKLEIIKEMILQDEFGAIENIKKLPKGEVQIIDYVDTTAKHQTLLDFCMARGAYYVAMFLLTQKLIPIKYDRILVINEDEKNTYIELLFNYETTRKLSSWQTFNLLYAFYQVAPQMLIYAPDEYSSSLVQKAFLKKRESFLLLFSLFYKDKINWDEQYIYEEEYIPDAFSITKFKSDEILFLLYLGLPPNELGRNVDRWVNSIYISSLPFYHSTTTKEYKYIDELISYGYTNFYKIKPTLSLIESLLKKSYEELLESPIMQPILKEFRSYSNLGEKYEYFLRYPHEVLEEKKKHLLYIENLITQKEELDRKKKEYNTQYESKVQLDLERTKFLKNIPARAEMLQRLGEFQRFLKSKRAQVIPSSAKVETLEKIKETVFNVDPDMNELEKLKETILEIRKFFVEVKSKYYSSPTNLNANIVNKLEEYPPVKNLNTTRKMEGGKRFRKTRSKRR